MLLDWLFGKKIELSDDFFGKIVSNRVRKNSLNKSLTWYCSYKFPIFKKETDIFFEGDQNGLNQAQKNGLKNFIEKFEGFYSLELDRLIEQNGQISQETKNWRNYFYIAAIFSESEYKCEFEICFETYEEDSNLYFDFELIGEKVNILDLKHCN